MASFVPNVRLSLCECEKHNEQTHSLYGFVRRMQQCPISTRSTEQHFIREKYAKSEKVMANNSANDANNTIIIK